MTRQEKRAVRRIAPFVVRCQVVCGGCRMAAYITDLSTSGARLALDQSLPEGLARLDLVVRLGSGPAAHLSADAKWSRPRANGKGFMVGVRFVDLSRDARERLETAVDAFRANAARLA